MSLKVKGILFKQPVGHSTAVLSLKVANCYKHHTEVLQYTFRYSTLLYSAKVLVTIVEGDDNLNDSRI